MVSVRLPEDINNQLEMLCNATKRPKSFYIKEALARYMEDMEDTYITLDRIASPDRIIYSSDDAQKIVDDMPDDE